MLLLPQMIRFSFFFSLSILPLACGKQKTNYDTNDHAPPSELYVDPDLQPYLDSYIADAAAAGVAIPEQKIQEFKGLMWTDQVKSWSAPDATHLGICQRRSGLRYVEILRPDAEGKSGNTLMDEATLKVTVYHELGHCLHDFSGHTSGQNAAVMNWFLQPARYFDLDGLIRDHFQMLKKIQENPSYRLLF